MRCLPAHCTQASLFRCLIDFDLCWEHTCQSLSTVLLCLSDPLPAVHQHRGALWGPERGHPGSLRLCSTEASVSQLTMPLCYRSSWPLFLLKVPEPPVYPPAKGPHAWGPPGLGSGANTGFRSDSLTISALLTFPPGHHSPSGGPRPLGERVWWSTVNICVCNVCEMEQQLQIPSASGLTDKAHFKLHKIQRVVGSTW